jgi:hypothetical protein
MPRGQQFIAHAASTAVGEVHRLLHDGARHRAGSAHISGGDRRPHQYHRGRDRHGGRSLPPAGECVYVLDPSSDLALNASKSVSVQSECGFWIDSNGTALTVIGGSTLAALDSTTIDLVGGSTNANGLPVNPAAIIQSVQPASERSRRKGERSCNIGERQC